MSPVSYSTIHPTQFELTPCRVNYKGVDLGATKGNVKVTIEEKLAKLVSDQLGDTIIDQKVSGFMAKVETSLDETQIKANWAVVFPAHKLVTDNLGNQSFYFDSQIGISMRSLAGPLILHPLSRVDSDKTGDILIYLATSEPKSDYVFSPSEQNVLKLAWDMYPDFTTQPPRFLLFGDPSIGIVNATAGAATAGTGNVGNGLVTGIAVNNSGTETEIITMLCVTPGSSGAFFVSGSQTGPQGLAKIGTTFNSAEISFLVSTGGTPFALNDSFTIATTAANFV